MTEQKKRKQKKTVKTVQGNDVILLDFCPDSYSKTVLLIGVFHGDEPDGEYLINRFLKSFDENFSKNRLLIIPCLNPDGKSLNRRTNGNGVDLNRNFPCDNWELNEKNEFYGGDTAASEIETRFVCNVIQKTNPDLIVTLHEPYRIVNYDGPAKEIALKISEITGYPVQEDIGYATPGSFGTYCGKERNIPTITIELPEKEPKEVLWAANKGVFDYLLNFS